MRANMDTAFATGVLGIIFGILMTTLWFRLQSRQQSDGNSLNWPEAEKPKNTEYQLTEDGELDGDFPVARRPPEPVPAEHPPGGYYPVYGYSTDMDEAVRLANNPDILPPPLPPPQEPGYTRLI